MRKNGTVVLGAKGTKGRHLSLPTIGVQKNRVKKVKNGKITFAILLEIRYNNRDVLF